MAENRQLPLELALAPRFGEEDFLISQSNADAYGMIEAWPDWASRLLVMTGPSASGKSHLAAIWAARAHARQLSARSLGKADVPALVASKAVVVEDIHRPGIEEAALFHLINLAEEKEASLLLTSARAPQELGIMTPDLLSRLRKAPLVSIAAPDDALIRALLVKLFVDRQLIVDTALVEYLCLRIERSFAAVRSTVEKLDRGAMARGKRLTRPVAASILGWMSEG
jgi:chromosomal replication initiation ATPase DnaA